MSEPVKIVICLEGGMVSSVLSAGVPVTYAVVDYDTDSADDDDIIMVPQHNAPHADAMGHIGDADCSLPAHALAMFDAVAAHEDADDVSPLHAAAALVRDGLDLMQSVEGIEDIEIEDGQLKVIAGGQCFRVSIEMIG